MEIVILAVFLSFLLEEIFVSGPSTPDVYTEFGAKLRDNDRFMAERF
jgi:hypothetical protein